MFDKKQEESKKQTIIIELEIECDEYTSEEAKSHMYEQICEHTRKMTRILQQFQIRCMSFKYKHDKEEKQ